DRALWDRPPGHGQDRGILDQDGAAGVDRRLAILVQLAGDVDERGRLGLGRGLLGWGLGGAGFRGVGLGDLGLRRRGLGTLGLGLGLGSLGLGGLPFLGLAGLPFGTLLRVVRPHGLRSGNRLPSDVPLAFRVRVGLIGD